VGEPTAATVVIVLVIYIDDVILGETLKSNVNSEVVVELEVTLPPPLPPLGVLEVLDVTEGEAPFVNDDVGDVVTVILLVAVLEKEDVKDELDVIVPVALIVADGVREEEDVIDIVTLSVLLGDTGALGLLLTPAPRERLDVGL
jgi:hypothetical protein